MFTKKITVIFQPESTCDHYRFLEKNVEYILEEKGMERVRDLDTDLVILDCCHVTGRCVDLLKMIKSAYPSLPVIFITDASSEKQVIEVFKSGARDYFKKPVDAKELRRTVDTILWLCGETTERRSPLTFFKHKDSGDPFRLSVDLPENIMRSVFYVEQNIHKPLNLDKIAREAGMSKFHFCRVFKRHLGVSPMQYAINMRLKKAFSLLPSKELSISAIALKSGFSDLSEFNKQFKKIYGSSPSAFREAIRTGR